MADAFEACILDVDLTRQARLASDSNQYCSNSSQYRRQPVQPMAWRQGDVATSLARHDVTQRRQWRDDVSNGDNDMNIQTEQQTGRDV